MTQRELLDFLSVAAKLKVNTRHCCTVPGRMESVADHCWRTALMAVLLENEFKDVDIFKVVKMCLVHDLGEALTGDIPTFKKTDEDRCAEKKKLFSMLGMLPAAEKGEMTELFKEMEELKTDEARLYKALDCMEAVISHNESELSTWIPLERTLNLTYGEKYVEWNDWLKELKKECNDDTIKKLAQKPDDGAG